MNIKMSGIQKRLFKKGLVIATNPMISGEEPTWDGWENWSTEKFFQTRRRMLRFYSSCLSSKDLLPFVLEYMIDNRYAKSDVELIRNANPNNVPFIIGKLTRAFKLGMPSMHPQAQAYFDSLPFHDSPPIAKDDADVVAAELSKTLSLLRAEQNSIKSIVPKKVLSKQNILEETVNKNMIIPLEKMLDDWCLQKEKTRVEGLSMTAMVSDSRIPIAGLKAVKNWLQKLLNEYKGAYDGTDSDLVEGYSYLTREALKNRVERIQEMINEVIAITNNGKPIRVKKIKGANKQVSDNKYQTDSREYKLTSVSPAKLATARRVILFNTKYRTLSVCSANSPAGFSIRRTSLYGIDHSNSFSLTLRKPGETLNGLLAATPKKIDTILNKIKGVRRKAKGRLNSHTIILKTIA